MESVLIYMTHVLQVCLPATINTRAHWIPTDAAGKPVTFLYHLSDELLDI